jgi:hypothetical protein
MYKSFYGTLLAINKDTAWHHIKEEGLSLEKYFHALFILKPLLDKVQYWLESNFIVCKCSWQIVLGGGRVFYIFLYLHRMILSSLPYKNMLPLQLLLDMILHFDKLDCHMVKLEKRQQQNSTTIDNAYTLENFKK